MIRDEVSAKHRNRGSNPYTERPVPHGGRRKGDYGSGAKLEPFVSRVIKIGPRIGYSFVVEACTAM